MSTIGREYEYNGISGRFVTDNDDLFMEYNRYFAQNDTANCAVRRVEFSNIGKKKYWCITNIPYCYNGIFYECVNELITACKEKEDIYKIEIDVHSNSFNKYVIKLESNQFIVEKSEKSFEKYNDVDVHTVIQSLSLEEFEQNIVTEIRSLLGIVVDDNINIECSGDSSDGFVEIPQTSDIYLFESKLKSIFKKQREDYDYLNLHFLVSLKDDILNSTTCELEWHPDNQITIWNDCESGKEKIYYHDEAPSIIVDDEGVISDEDYDQMYNTLINTIKNGMRKISRKRRV